ncbi:MAG: hypothetical protein IJ325_04435 [Clostridia bacterium]|nr:hypothetical protein [Clostridia bacterium]
MDYKDLYSYIKHASAAGGCEDHSKIVFTGINNRIVDMEIPGGAALPAPVYMVEVPPFPSLSVST